MSAVDLTAGYPVHAVAEYGEWTNDHGAVFTDWVAACGAIGTAGGRACHVLGLAGSARRLELCRECWPAGHATHHDAPKPFGPEGTRR